MSVESRRHDLVPINGPVVYIARDEQDHVLYIGFSTKAFARIGSHQQGSEWWQFVARLEVVQCDSESEGRRLESCLIREMEPFFNLKDRGRDSLFRQKLGVCSTPGCFGPIHDPLRPGAPTVCPPCEAAIADELDELHAIERGRRRAHIASF